VSEDLLKFDEEKDRIARLVNMTQEEAEKINIGVLQNLDMLRPVTPSTDN